MSAATLAICPHCLEEIEQGDETSTVHNGDGRYADQIMHGDCAESYRDGYAITWPNGERTGCLACGGSGETSPNDDVAGPWRMPVPCPDCGGSGRP